MRLSVLSCPLDVVAEEAVHNRLKDLLSSDCFSFVVTLNSLLVLESEKSSDVSLSLKNASFVLPDSQGIVWASKILHDVDIKRYAGIDLAWNLCRLASQHGVSVYLLGGKPEICEKAAQVLQFEIPGLQIAGYQHGYYSPEQEPDVVDRMARSGARLFLVALGMPRQELFLNRYRRVFPHGLGIGIGGSFDVWAGRLKRAPKWIQNWGIEWLYRLIQEPSRWRRMAQLPFFLLTVFFDWFRKKRS